MNDRKYLQLDQVSKLNDMWSSWYRKKAAKRAKFYWVWLMLLHTGARISEVLELDDKSFLPDQHAIKIRRLKLKDKTKVHYKTITVSSSAFTSITLLRQAAANHGLVSPSYLNFYWAFKECCKLAGITDKRLTHPHAMRHSYAVYLLDSGLDSAYVMQLLGHTSINSTMIYLQKTAEDLGKILEQKGLLRA